MLSSSILLVLLDVVAATPEASWVTILRDIAFGIATIAGILAGAYALYKSKKSDVVEQTVRSQVQGENVLEVTTKSSHAEDLVRSNDGIQVFQAHYQKIIDEQGEIINGYRSEREQDRERFIKIESKVENLETALTHKDAVIEFKEQEISQLKDLLARYQKERERNIEKIDDLEHQLRRLAAEITLLKENK